MTFTDLAVYTITANEAGRFRSGNHFIVIDDRAKSITFDLDDNSHILVRFDNGKSLIKTVINGVQERTIVPLKEISSHLRSLNLETNLVGIANDVPFLRKVLA